MARGGFRRGPTPLRISIPRTTYAPSSGSSGGGSSSITTSMSTMRITDPSMTAPSGGSSMRITTPGADGGQRIIPFTLSINPERMAKARRAMRDRQSREAEPVPGVWIANVFLSRDIDLEMPITIRVNGQVGKMPAVLNPDGTVSALPPDGPKNVRPVDSADEMAGDDLGRGGGPLTVAQQATAAIITRVMQARGVPDEVIKAAIVNAVAESGLRADAVGDGGRSVGLFQLHERGAGAGMSVADRKDPVKNTGRITDVYLGSQGKPVRAAYAAGERRVDQLAALWSANVERPADRAGEMAKRAALALVLFPMRAGEAVATAAGDAVATANRATWPKYVLGGAVVLLAVVAGQRWKAHADMDRKWAVKPNPRRRNRGKR